MSDINNGLLFSRSLQFPKQNIKFNEFVNLADFMNALPNEFKIVHRFINLLLSYDHVSSVWALQNGEYTSLRMKSCKLMVKTDKLYITAVMTITYVILSLNHPQSEQRFQKLSHLLYYFDDLLNDLGFRGYSMDFLGGNSLFKVILQSVDGFLSVCAFTGNLDFLCAYNAFGETFYVRKKLNAIQNPLPLLQMSVRRLVNLQEPEHSEFIALSYPNNYLCVYVLCNISDLEEFKRLTMNNIDLNRIDDYSDTLNDLKGLVNELNSSSLISEVNTEFDRHSREVKYFDYLESNFLFPEYDHNALIVITVDDHVLVATACIEMEISIQDYLEEPIVRTIACMDSIRLEVSELLFYSSDYCTHSSNQFCQHKRCFLKCYNNLYELKILIRDPTLTSFVKSYITYQDASEHW